MAITQLLYFTRRKPDTVSSTGVRATNLLIYQQEWLGRISEWTLPPLGNVASDGNVMLGWILI